MYIPTAYDTSAPVPLLLDFHGFYDDAGSEAREDGVDLAAEREGFVVVYPNGLADNPRDPGNWWNQWNGGGTNGTIRGRHGSPCVAEHSLYPCYESCIIAGACRASGTRQDCACSGCSDDVGFVAALLEHLKGKLCLDLGRIHGTGISNGAIFLYYLATTQDVGPQLASIVPVEGSFILGFLDAPKVPMPVIDIHGKRDRCVPANVSNSWGPYKVQGCPNSAVGKGGCTVGDDGWLYHPVDEVLAHWAGANGCPPGEKPKRVATRHDGKTKWSCMLPFGGCAAPVWRCTHGLGHTWPFGEGKKGARTKEFGEALWDFMRDKRRERPAEPAIELVF